MMNTYIGKICPYCRRRFNGGEDVVFCSSCELPHHKSCWMDNGGCTSYGCNGSGVGVDRPTEILSSGAQSKYDILWHTSQCTIQDDAVVLLEKVAVIRDNTDGSVYVRLNCRSLSDKPIRSMLLDITARDSRGNELEGLSGYQFKGYVTRKNSVFGQNIPIKMPSSETAEVDVFINKILFEDRNIYECKKHSVTTLPQARTIVDVLGSQRLAEEYMLETSPNSKYVPCVGERLWRCSCGTVNENVAGICPRCRAIREDIISKYNPDRLRNNMNRHAEEKRQREEAERLEMERRRREEEERILREQEERDRARREQKEASKKKRKKVVRRIVILLTSLILLAGIAYGAIVYGIPYAKYTQASKFVDEKNYEDAYNLYTELGDYRDSSEKASNAIYIKAEELKAQKNYLEAAKEYDRIQTYSDSKDKAEECRNEDAYLKAVKEYEDKKYEDAISSFEALGDYSDSKDWVNKSRYAIAKDDFDRKDYPKALEEFKQLGNYEDSIELANESKYKMAEQALAEKNYEEALKYFSELTDYKSSDDKVKETQYTLAGDLMDQKRYKEAYEMYSSSQLKDYKDSVKKSHEAAYYYAVKCYEDKSYDDAIDYFIKSDGYENANDLLMASKYEKAQELARSQDYEKAIQIFQELGDYGDCENKIVEAKYGYIITHRNSTDTVTYEYIKELKAMKYLDTADIFSDLYQWRVRVLGINVSGSKTNTKGLSSISRSDALFIHYEVLGGEPGATLKLRFHSTAPDKQTVDRSTEDSAGIQVVGWETGIYSRPENGKTGTFYTEIYDLESGKKLTETSINITY